MTAWHVVAFDGGGHGPQYAPLTALTVAPNVTGPLSIDTHAAAAAPSANRALTLTWNVPADVQWCVVPDPVAPCPSPNAHPARTSPRPPVTTARSEMSSPTRARGLDSTIRTDAVGCAGSGGGAGIPGGGGASDGVLAGADSPL